MDYDEIYTSRINVRSLKYMRVKAMNYLIPATRIGETHKLHANSEGHSEEKSIRVELLPVKLMVLVFSAFIVLHYATCPFDMTSMMEHAINARLPAAFYREKAQVRPKERNIVILRQECFESA